MKKLLSLALAVLIAVSGTITASADVVDAWKKDMSENHWARSAVNFFKGIGYLDGTLLREDEPTIDPDKSITRAEFVSLINLVVSNNFLNDREKADFDEYNQNEILNTFADVDEKHWAKKHISWAVENITIGGYLNGKGVDEQGRAKIAPDDGITRQEAMTMISKVIMQKKAFATGNAEMRKKLKGGEYSEFINPEAKGSLKFDDVDQIAKWALPFVEDCYNKKIVSGNDKNEIQPLKKITRAEALSILKKVIEKENLKVGK